MLSELLITDREMDYSYPQAFWKQEMEQCSIGSEKEAK